MNEIMNNEDQEQPACSTACYECASMKTILRVVTHKLWLLTTLERKMREENTMRIMSTF